MAYTGDAENGVTKGRRSSLTATLGLVVHAAGKITGA